MRRVPLLLVPLVPLVPLLAACGTDDDSAAATSGPSPATAAAGTSDEQQAIADLAARSDVEPATITTVSVDEVTWASAAIGCPEPDKSYMQSLVPGTRVVLELDGTTYEYHAGGDRPIFLCAHPEPPVEG